ncbi:unnamed protein product [Durusdinium trenchii]|uniref:GPR180/TMEM145 transmembrane domain-containing protein n=1 Tax=Durusdinium trenchii TaxID=1381693 RepID=A0ABP0JQ64_9DINO
MRCAVLLLCILPFSTAWRTSGTLPNLDSFIEYVGKFCFDFKKHAPGMARPVVGNVEVLLRGRVAEGPPCYGLRPCEANGHLYLIVFDDEEAHGQLVRHRFGQLSCEEMVNSASWAQIIKLDRREEFRMSENITESIRPRFWYFTFAACGIKMEVPAFFEIHAQNVLQGFESEFGMDQQGSLLLQVAAASGFMGLFLALRMGSKATGSEALRSRPLLRILLISSGCSSIGACCFCMHWAVYASDGTGLLAMEVAGTGLVALAKALLAILQLMLAKGWALFYSPQQLLQRQAIVSAVLLIVVISILCELHEVLFHDWSARIYMYENWSGFTILVLNCLLFAEAWRSMRDTFVLEGTEEIRRFYVFISFVSILYFLTLPLVCLLASLLSPWVRAKYVDRCEVGCRFLATLILGHLLRPSRMDAMLNARMEEPVETVGEPAEEGQIISAAGSVPLTASCSQGDSGDQCGDGELPAE